MADEKRGIAILLRRVAHWTRAVPIRRTTTSLIVRDGGAPFELSNDIWIERLDEELAKRGMTLADSSAR